MTPIPDVLPAVQIGDGVTIATDWTDGQMEATFSVFGEEIAVAYVDDKGSARVDFHQRMNVGLEAFKRTMIVWILAWSHAEQLAVAWHQRKHEDRRADVGDIGLQLGDETGSESHA